MRKHDVNDNYVKLKNHIDQVIEAHIPSKRVTTRINVPWITTNIKRMCRKKTEVVQSGQKDPQITPLGDIPGV